MALMYSSFSWMVDAAEAVSSLTMVSDMFLVCFVC